ncbi:MAG: cysteine--tRNA ligase [Clostridiales bacterium GWC2_40_7]|nr:MAG: cysteine--tRNA ligase [Clostridiales bacterium GWC2_40_7]
MKLFNTLTKQKEEFVPLEEGHVKMYSCGPTVYQYAHIGNLRTYVFMDILRRVLKYNGYTLNHVMNITDVGHLVADADEGEDKMLKTAKEQKKTPWEIAEYFTGVFFKDAAALNIGMPEIVPRATGHINEMIEFIAGLVDKGYAYETSNGIYFDIGRFEGYGKLSGLDLEGQIAGARVDVNEEKRHPADFALWKKAPKEHIMQWPSPWGMGYPGWHIECSAMSRKYLGDVFDIHTGGVDHIPVHHENEIAQSEALIGKPAVNYWMHGEFLLVDNGKMSKSLGNTYTVDDLKKNGIDPLAFRYLCLNANYRSKLNFTWEVIKSAQVSLDRLLEGVLVHRSGVEKIEPEVLSAFKRDFEEAVNDDLNIPRALGIVWNIVRYGKKSKDLYQLLLEMDSILGLDIANVKESRSDEIDPEIQELVNQRQQARKDKNWKLADEIRDKLKGMGITLEDTPQGVKIVKN